VDDAIAAGTLPGVSVESRGRIAAAAAAGVVLVDPGDAAIADTLERPEGAPTDVTRVTGVGSPAIYAVGGTTMWRIDAGQDNPPPAVTNRVADPSRISTPPQVVHVSGCSRRERRDDLRLEPSGTPSSRTRSSMRPRGRSTPPKRPAWIANNLTFAADPALSTPAHALYPASAR
jgi:hypothetical protein